MQKYKYVWKGWWHSITGFNVREEDYIYEYILFGLPGKSDKTIVANYCILYAKQYIYLEKLKNKNTNFKVEFLGYGVTPKIYIKNGRKHMYKKLLKNSSVNNIIYFNYIKQQ